MKEQARSIAEIMNQASQRDFLVKILHKINQEIQLAFTAIYNQVCDAQEAAFVIEPTIVTTMFVKLNKMFEKIVLHQVSDFLLPVLLDLAPEQETHNDEQAPRGRVTKKQKRLEKNDTVSTTQNYKQKVGMVDLWGLPVESDFDDIFGDNTKGNELVAKICDYKFRHHQKKGRSFQDTPLCIPYVVGQLCPKGKGCPKNHCQRKDLKRVAEQRADVQAINILITDQYPKK